MVSIFDEKEEALAFKTVIASGGKYTATFNMTFTEDMEVTIKVGDINSTDYKLSTLEVEKTKAPVRSNKLTDDGGNSLTILDELKKFDLEDELSISMEDDLDNLSGEEAQIVNFIRRQLGDMKELYAVMDIAVINGEERKEFTDTEDGYELFINIPKEALEGFNKPMMARVLDDVEFIFEDGKLIEYDEDAEGAVVKLNNIGLYVVYDDLTKDYKFLDKTEEQTYNTKKDGDLVLKVDADVKKFVSLSVDGKLVDEKNYSVKSGSTVITLKKEYVQSLSEGNHTIKVNFTDGEANANLTIEAVNPKTADDIIKYVIILVIGVLGFGSGIVYLTKRVKN